MTQSKPSELSDLPIGVIQVVDRVLQDTLCRYLEEENYGLAIQVIHREIQKNPLNSALFSYLGDLYEKAGKLGESIVAYDRALQLREISARYEPTPAAWHLKDLHRYKKEPDIALELEGMIFPRIICLGEGDNRRFVGRSLDGHSFIKFSYTTDARERKRCAHEIEVLKRLEKHGCYTSPTIRGHGSIEGALLRAALDKEFENASTLLEGKEKFEFQIAEFLRRDPTPSFGDIALSMLEHKRAGIYIGKVRESSLRFNAESGICHLVGFKDAIILEPKIQALPAKSYFEWARDREGDAADTGRKKGRSLLFGNGETHYPFWDIFLDESLNLEATQPFREQLTIQHPKKIYHSLKVPDLFINGVVEFDEQLGELLSEAFPLECGERILDVGCAGAQYSHFIANRGCQVTGIDVDAQLMNGCNILGRILDEPMRFERLNLDYENLNNAYDTACLFHVLSYFKDPKKVADKLVQSIRKRILFVGKLEESGFRRKGNVIEKSDGWAFEEVGELVDWLKELFEGFSLVGKPVELSKDRYFITLETKGGPNG